MRTTAAEKEEIRIAYHLAIIKGGKTQKDAFSFVARQYGLPLSYCKLIIKGLAK